MISRAWAPVRTALAIGGISFATASIGSACLDYAGEDLAVCDEIRAGNASATSSSTSSSGANASDAGLDCGPSTALPVGNGSGSGSGAP